MSSATVPAGAHRYQPASEQLAARQRAYTEDLHRVVRTAAPAFIVAMTVELVSHLPEPTTAFILPTAIGIAVLIGVTIWRRDAQQDTAWIGALLIAEVVWVVIVQHVIVGAYLSSSIFLSMAVLACGALVMPLVPMLLTTLGSWALLLWVTVVYLPYPAASVFPLPVLALIVAMIMHSARKQAINAGLDAAELAAALARSRTQTELFEQQQDFTRTVGAGLAHHLANRMQVMQFALDEAAAKTGEPASDTLQAARSAAAAAAAAAAADARNLIAKLQVYTGMPNSRREHLSGEAVVAALETRYGDALRANCEHQVSASADAALVTQAAVELVGNALNAVDGQRTPPPEVDLRVRATDRHMEICVEDNGDGFDSALRARAIDPFVTNQPAGKVGLGMSFVQGVAEMHQGQLSIEARAPRGSRVVLKLPRLSDHARGA